MVKKKAKSRSALERKKPCRSSYDVVLIVCEGAKTEPAYFRGLRDNLQLSTANIEIVPADEGNSKL